MMPGKVEVRLALGGLVARARVWKVVCVRVLNAITGAVVLAALSAPVANAAWTRPSVLVTGDDAGLLDTVARPDGSLRAAIVGSRRGIAMGLVDGSGEAVVAWQTNGFPSDLAAAVRLPGAGVSKARFVSRDAGYAQLAVGPGGQAILAAAWLAAPRQRGPEQVRVYAGDGRLRRIGTVGRDALGENVEVAVDGAGATVVSWEEALRSKRGDPTTRSHLAVAYRRPGGRLGAVRYFGPVSLDDSPESVRLGPAGRAWVLYEAFEPGDFGDRAGYRRVYVTERRP